MSKRGTQFPLGVAGSEKVNVAVQRPTVNLREAENVGEQMAAVNHQKAVPGVDSQPIGSPFKKSGWGGGHAHNLWERE
jgi:hypothetical protein